jgi:hypothetical protein
MPISSGAITGRSSEVIELFGAEFEGRGRRGSPTTQG